jgi:NCAIR mutase (PurE)-related protein
MIDQRSSIGNASSDHQPEIGRPEPFMDSHELTRLFATVDLHRAIRCGSPEVIFGQGKTVDQIVAILRTLIRHGHGGLVTRVAIEAGPALQEAFPEGDYNQTGRTFWVAGPDPGPKLGRVIVVTAGTSDLPVAEEARVAAEAWNCEVSLVADVGVAGIHRLFNRLAELQEADVLVVVAGMEGALPSVIGGLVACPIIAVPTSIGYGASFGGLSALLTMLNSCASNVLVVNIDAGFNGGHVAGLIARRAGQARAGVGSGESAESKGTVHHGH